MSTPNEGAAPAGADSEGKPRPVSRPVSVALAPEEYDIVHEDEDAELMGFFLEAVEARIQSLRALLPKLGSADSRYAYEEIVNELSASANYLDIAWILDLSAEQRTVLRRIDTADSAGREESVAALSKGLGRLWLLLQPRDQALQGMQLPRPEALPTEEHAEPKTATGLPPEFDALLRLGQTLVRVLGEAEHMREDEQAAVRRQVGDILAEMTSVGARLSDGSPPK